VPNWIDTLGGTWTDSANWTGGVPNGVGAIANFNFTANTGTTMIVGILDTSAIRLGQLNVSLQGTLGVTIRGSTADTGTGVGRMIFNGGALDARVTVDDANSSSGEFLISGTNGLRVELESNTVFDITTNNVTLIDAPIQGSGTLIKDGFGILKLTGSNSFTGGFRIEDGTLRAEGVALGSGTIRFNTTGASDWYVSGTVNNTIATLAGSTGKSFIRGGGATFTGALSHQSTGILSFDTLNDPAEFVTISFTSIAGNGTEANVNIFGGKLRFGNSYSAANLFNLPGEGASVFGREPALGPLAVTLDTSGFATRIRNPLFQNIVVLETTSGTINVTFNDVNFVPNIASDYNLIINGTGGFDRLIFNVAGDLRLDSPESNQEVTFNNWISTDLIEINGSAVANEITGSTEREFIYGNDGNDILAGGGGVDTIDGGNGNDIIALNGTNDGSNVAGGAGTDRLRIDGIVSSIGTVTGFEALEMENNGEFYISGAKFTAGFDLFSTLSGTGSIVVSLAAGGETLNARLMSVAPGSNVQLIVNGNNSTGGNDIIKGVIDAPNQLRGNIGNDQIVGGALVDIITGGTEADKIRGDGGADNLSGGTGADVFKYRNVSDSTLVNPDTITDFLSGTDRLNFVRIDTNPGLAGDQGFTFIGTSAFNSNGVAKIRYTDLGADLRVEADVNGDGVADMHILLVGAGAGTLSAGDFVL
jgi:autotransporter-associated beta strand protein